MRTPSAVVQNRISCFTLPPRAIASTARQVLATKIQAIRQGMRGFAADRQGRSLRFAADQVPDVIAVRVALRGFLDLERPRTRQVDLHLLADAPRARGEDDHPIAEE